MGSLFSSTLNTRALPVDGMRYIRSDAPLNLTREEIQWLLDNNITTLVDLRSEQELKRKPCPLQKMEEFTYYHLPVTGGEKIPKSREQLYESYQGMIDGQMELILDTILNAVSNVMYFCTAGKDRTGVVSALLLKRLGVPENIILEDYMESKENLIDMLTAYAEKNPEADIDIMIPKAENIRKILKQAESNQHNRKQEFLYENFTCSV